MNSERVRPHFQPLTHRLGERLGVRVNNIPLAHRVGERLEVRANTPCRTCFSNPLRRVEWVFEEGFPLQNGATSGDVQ